jgi:kynurenine formamidase
MPRWKRRPEGSNWGDFGEDDQLGRMNLLTPERRRRAVAEAREGIAFSLSLPLDYPGGSGLSHGLRKPPQLFAGTIAGVPVYNMEASSSLPGCRDISSDDGVILYTQYSTQWDSLAHWGGLFDANNDGVAEKLYYNGYRAGIDVLGPDQNDGPHATALGMEHMAATGVQGRGVLINLHAAYGSDRVKVGYDLLIRAIEAQKVVVETGDFCCLYTGFDEILLRMNKSPDLAVLNRSGAVLDGADKRLLQWITESGVVALCSDNLGIEAIGDTPLRETANGSDFTVMPVHEHCLFKLGVHLGELWLLRDLAAWLQKNDRSAFLLTAPPLRLPGSVGSPVTPVATV